MSKIADHLNQNQGVYTALGNIAAIAQRQQILNAQRDQIAALERQHSATQQIERRRLQLEELRAQADAEERALKQEQLAKLKEIRNFMADTAFEFEQLRKRYG